MSKQNPASKAPSTPKQSVKTPAVAESAAGVTELVPETLLAGIDQQGRSAQLSDPRLATLQRQTLAGKIGGQQGNGHLQQMISLAQQNQRHAPYQPNTIHRTRVAAPLQRKTEPQKQESDALVSDEELAALWGESEAGLMADGQPSATPKAPHTTLQRAEAAPPADTATKVPTEEEKAAAKAKAAAARAKAAQAANQGQAEASKFQAGKDAEKTAGQSEQQKASDSNSRAPKPKQATVADNAMAEGASGLANGRSRGAGIAGNAALNSAAGGASNGTLPDKTPASAAEDPAFQNVTAAVKGVAGAEQRHAPATAKAKEAQAAAESPASEIAGKAQSNQVGDMAAAETPGFNGAAFKEKLMKRIQKLTPKNAEDADQFKEQNKAGQLKGDLQNETTTQKEQSQAPLAAASEKAPDTGSVEAKAVTPLAPNTPGAAPATPDASGAAPKAKSSAEVEAPMQQQSQQLDQQMAQANVTEEQLAKSNEPEFQSAATAKEQSQANAQSAPQAYRQDEQSTLKQAQGEAGTIAQAQLGAMHGDRASVLEQVGGQQAQGKGKDEKARADVGAHIQSVYDTTQSQVEQILSSLDKEVDQLFNNGAESARQTFESYVDAEMEAYKEERYGGWLGWAQWLADKIQPTQPEVFAIFQRGRGEYIKAMDAVIDNVVALIGRKLAEAKAAIANGKLEIQNYVATLDPSLQQVGQEAAQNIQSQFDELAQSVDAKQDQLIDSLANKYNEKLQAVDARIEQLKAENQTLYDMAADAVGGVIKTILQLKDMLLNVLARAAAAIEKIIADPIGFLGNLIDGVKLGLKNFMGNIGTHLQGGFISWLTGAIAGAGITLPENWDLAGIFQLVMQLLGLGFDKIMGKVSEVLGFDVMGMIEPIKQLIEIYQAEGFAGLAKMGLERLIGEEHMESLMHVWGIIQNVISGNWGALWGMLQEYLTNLKEMVFGKITEFITERVIKGGITWIISLFNPAGAFIKACKAIYDIVMFFVERGSQIMSLVNAVIDSVSAIAGGNINVAATAIEGALAKGIPVAIGFLSSLLGLGNVSEKVQEIIGSVRGLVENGINKVLNSKPVQMVAGFIKKVVGKIKGVVKAGADKVKGVLGIGPDAEQKAVDKASMGLKKKDATPDSVRSEFPSIEAEYKLDKPLKLIHVSGNTYLVQTTKSKEITIGGFNPSSDEILIIIREVAQRIYEDEEAKETEEEIRYTAITNGQYSDEKRKDLADLGEPVDQYDDSKGLGTSVFEGAERIGRIRYNRAMGKRRYGLRENVVTGLDQHGKEIAVNNQALRGAAPYVKSTGSGSGKYIDLAKDLQAIGDPAVVSTAIQQFIRTGRMPPGYDQHKHVIAEVAELMTGIEGMRTPSSIVTTAMTMELMSSKNDPRRQESGKSLGWQEMFERNPMTPRGAEKLADSVNANLGFDGSHKDKANFLNKPDRKRMASQKKIAAAKQTEAQLAVDWLEAKMKDTGTKPFDNPEQLKKFIETQIRKFYGIRHHKD